MDEKDFLSKKDCLMMGDNVKKYLKKCGRDVKIHPFAKIVNPQNIEIDDFAIIDDFSLIIGGNGIKIGKFVHISSFSSIIGGGKLIMENFSGLSAGCRIITGSDDFSGRSLTNPCVPKEFKPNCYTSTVKICRHSILGTNTIVHPGVTIAPYTATGSNTVVLKNIGPAAIYVGCPAKKVKERPVEKMISLEKSLMDKIYG